MTTETVKKIPNIIIRERPYGPGDTPAYHVIAFPTGAQARAAYAGMVNFWNTSGHRAVKFEGPDVIVTVASELVSSVTLNAYDADVTVAKPKMKKKGKKK